jgi:hypothetical protein
MAVEPLRIVVQAGWEIKWATFQSLSPQRTQRGEAATKQGQTIYRRVLFLKVTNARNFQAFWGLAVQSNRAAIKNARAVQTFR